MRHNIRIPQLKMSLTEAQHTDPKNDPFPSMKAYLTHHGRVAGLLHPVPLQGEVEPLCQEAEDFRGKSRARAGGGIRVGVTGREEGRLGTKQTY